MKAPALLLLIGLSTATAAISGCSKDPECVEPRTDASITARWELQQITGGLSGKGQPLDPSKKVELEFLSNGTVNHYRNGQLLRSTPYVLNKGVTSLLLGSQLVDVVTINNSVAERYIVELGTRTLILQADAYDGFGYKYTR